MNAWPFAVRPAFCWIARPTAFDPVKEMNRVAGWIVAYVRFLGFRDTLTRAVLVALVLAIVIAVVAFPVLSAPSPPPMPAGAS